MNVRIVRDALTKKNVPGQKGINGCMFQKVFWKSGRNLTQTLRAVGRYLLED